MYKIKNIFYKYFSITDITAVLIKVLTAFFLVFSNMVITKYFNDKQLSLYYLIVPTTSFFTMIFVSPITIFLINNSILNKHNIYKLITEYFIYLSLIGIIFILPINFIFFKIDTITRLLLILYIFFEINIGTISGIIVQNESLNGYLKKSVYLNLVNSSTLIIFPICFGYIWSWSLNVWIIGLIFARFTQVPFFYFATNFNFDFISIKPKLNILLNNFFQNISSIIKLSLNSVLGWFHNNMSKILITFLLGITSAAPFLYVYSISATIATISEGFVKPILDRKIFTSIHGSIDKENLDPLYIYIFIAVLGFIFIPILGNILSKYRYSHLMNLSRIIFVFELFRLYMYYKISIFQIKFGYNKGLLINTFFLIIYATSLCVLFFIKQDIKIFYLIYTFLLIVILFLNSKIPRINRIRQIIPQ